MKTRKKPLAVMAAVLACIMALPAPAWATEPQEDPAVTVNESVVVFAGHEWWVIGDGTTGINQQPGTITLLAKEDVYGDTVFRTGHGEEFEGSQYDSENDMYYAANPDGSAWTSPTEYAGSTLQQAMDAIAKGFSEKEQAAILDRVLQGGGTVAEPSADGIAGPEIAQKLWALSLEEWQVLDNDTVRTFTDGSNYDDWWKVDHGSPYLLRTPYPYYSRIRKAVMSKVVSTHDANGQQNFQPIAKITTYIDSAAYSELAVRPAFSLDSSKILLTTGSADKSAAAIGDGLTGMPAPTGTLKLTIVDSSQTLKVIATKEQKDQTSAVLRFGYSNATTGRGQFISCILVDENGDVAYYAKLASCDTAASGTLSIPVKGVAQGQYTLKIFSEEANGDLYADFTSEPITMTVNVSAGTATVSDYSGDVLHEHALTKVEAKKATCTEDGNVEYWVCEECDQYFSDENGTSPITEEQTLVKAAGHKFENGVCSACGAKDPDYSAGESSDPEGSSIPEDSSDPEGSSKPEDSSNPGDSSKPEDSSNPDAPAKTGDNSAIWLYSLLLIACGGGLAAVIVLKKRGQKTNR